MRSLDLVIAPWIRRCGIFLFLFGSFVLSVIVLAAVPGGPFSYPLATVCATRRGRRIGV